MLGQLAGQQHEVLTAVYMATATADSLELDRSLIQFAPLSDAVIDAYVATGEPMDKAGAYGIQGLGAVLVERIEGSFSGVAGLPLARVERMLRSLGIDPWALRDGSLRNTPTANREGGAV